MENLSQIEEIKTAEKSLDKIDICSAKIEDVRIIGNVKIFKIKAEHKINFTTGQFFMLSDPNFKNESGVEIKRAYSCCSSENHARHLEFAIGMLDDGTFSKHFKNFKENDTLCIKGPFGHFVLDKEKDATFICGGTGVTPFISMLRTIRDQKLYEKIKATLIYSVKTIDTVLFHDELLEMSRLPNIKIIICVTRQDDAKSDEFKIYTKRIDEEVLRNNVDSNSQVYFCGPKEMMVSAKDILKNFMGEDNFHQERW